MFIEKKNPLCLFQCFFRGREETPSLGCRDHHRTERKKARCHRAVAASFEVNNLHVALETENRSIHPSSVLSADQQGCQFGSAPVHQSASQLPLLRRCKNYFIIMIKKKESLCNEQKNMDRSHLSLSSSSNRQKKMGYSYRGKLAVRLFVMH
jgi:hypothetical protein